MCGGMSTKVVQEPEAQVVCSVVAPRPPRHGPLRPEPGTVLVRTFRSTCKIMHSYGSVCFAHSGVSGVSVRRSDTRLYESQCANRAYFAYRAILRLFRPCNGSGSGQGLAAGV